MQNVLGSTSNLVIMNGPAAQKSAFLEFNPKFLPY